MRPLPCASPVRLVRALVRCRRLSANGAQASFGGWRARGRGKGQCHIHGMCAAPVSRFTAASLEGGAAGSIASGVVGPTRQSRQCRWRLVGSREAGIDTCGLSPGSWQCSVTCVRVVRQRTACYCIRLVATMTGEHRRWQWQMQWQDRRRQQNNNRFLIRLPWCNEVKIEYS